ncbi:HSP20-like chaperone [Conidiobolus coronatus NRRL 28638]|uniref:HSP20-like chaperone n=1 Tax=Conidiobolus coronatus (strain ATCC 28846 / CBS 209.66 / NRRL 28638) TaxID=796925 RepID=A0A137NX44_CONC2|nr:HSP20-like chaperone [Conidiobolus coronatus NRRL 28638]|eukprot:KXN67268.1 HSP20-like chaperone [Conidiobolus coronatus NRRL 28638]
MWCRKSFFEHAHKISRSGLSSFFRGAGASNFFEKELKYVIQTQVPGFSKNEIKVKFHPEQQQLSISGRPDYAKLKDQHPELFESFNNGFDHYNNFGRGSEFWHQSDKLTFLNEAIPQPFERTFQFPTKITPDTIEVSLERGILNVNVPKHGEGNWPKNIEIKEV